MPIIIIIKKKRLKEISLKKMSLRKDLVHYT